eukprot:13496424-Alexandrium_andersonii.AAC.1
MHMCNLESPNPEAVHAFCDQIVAFTTDMGPEIGIAGAVAGGFRPWLPSDLRGGDDIEADGGGEAPEGANPSDAARYLFKSAIPVAGCLHVFDSAAEAAHQSMQYWETFR